MERDIDQASLSGAQPELTEDTSTNQPIISDQQTKEGSGSNKSNESMMGTVQSKPDEQGPFKQVTMVISE